MIPGLIDIHMHIESSMTCPSRFGPLALSHGTTTIVADAHEIANVFGMKGIAEFQSQKTEMDIFWAIPAFRLQIQLWKHLEPLLHLRMQQLFWRTEISFVWEK
mgnify:CR=1 FL=1